MSNVQLFHTFSANSEISIKELFHNIDYRIIDIIEALYSRVGRSILQTAHNSLPNSQEIVTREYFPYSIFA